ncbi:MAG: hypothetical protein ILA39_06750 [Bacteroidaceae bacterium]|nr:hypothetical protein [Bacteroidaceae bacterium]
MKLVSFYIVIILSIILSSCSKNNNQSLVSYDETAVYERDSAIVVACRMMSNDSTEEALFILDSLGVTYPNYPLIPFLHGFAYQISGDSCKASPQYWKSIQMYDSMMAVRPKTSTAINRAYCFLFMNGEDVFRQCLDSIKQTSYFKKDSVSLDLLYELERDSLFKILLEQFKFPSFGKKE